METESSDDEKRVVRTEKDKRFGNMREVIRKIKDKMKNKDFKTLIDLFADLIKELDKAKKVVEKDGIPSFFVRILV